MFERTEDFLPRKEETIRKMIALGNWDCNCFQ